MSPHRLTSGERNSAGGCLDCGVSGTLELGARSITHREGCAATWWLCLKGPQGRSHQHVRWTPGVGVSQRTP